ncbi:MAG: hypothetical protein IT581_14065 [Verrucomicrobiales bacterium]|nr:hypothetical protein [Verrucomicrobiales bacterium]
MAQVQWIFRNTQPINWMFGMVQFSGTLPGGAGSNGWSPVFALVADGERRVYRVSDWAGGSGAKPATGQYVGSAGLVSDIAQATDLRGTSGGGGWAPIMASVVDGDRVVQQIVDWVGGIGTKPAVGKFIGPSGLVTAIADATDIRGQMGPAGEGAGNMDVATYDPDADGKVAAADAADVVPWTGVTGKPSVFPPSVHAHVIGDLPIATSGESSAVKVVRADDSRLSNARTPSAHTHVLGDLPVASTGEVSNSKVVRADDLRLSNSRTPSAHTHVLGELPVAASGESDPSKVVRSDDARLSNARTPSAHTHVLGDLPVATSGESNSAKVVRSDDARLSDARAPLAHAHVITDLPVAASGESSSTKVARSDDSRLAQSHTHTNSGVLSKIGESAGAPTWNGAPWPGVGTSLPFLSLTCPDDGLNYRVYVRMFDGRAVPVPVQEGVGPASDYLELYCADANATYLLKVRIQDGVPVCVPEPAA